LRIGFDPTLCACATTCRIGLLQESNLAARQPQGATSVIQTITGEGLAQGPYMYVAARGGVDNRSVQFKFPQTSKAPLESQAQDTSLKHSE